MRLIDKAAFRARECFSSWVLSRLRKTHLRALGLTIGDTRLPRCFMTWPHKVSIGDHAQLEDNIYYKHDGIWSEGKSIIIGNRVFIGRDCEFNIRKKITICDNVLIASGCKFIDHDHGHANGSLPMVDQPGPEEEILLDENVWLGSNVIVLKGVRIGTGAIVGAGTVVTRSIPAYEIWAGIPAKRISTRKLQDPVNE